ncbi:AraC family transcriptional regulator [Pseudoalteromonas xiamenensis]
MYFQKEQQTLPVVAFAHSYSHGIDEPEHTHTCAQLLHTLSGVLRVTTPHGRWIIPPDRALWLPANLPHSVKAHGQVEVRTLYLDPFARADLPSDCGIFQVPALLKALIISAVDIPAQFPRGGREERIFELILDELRGLSMQDFNVPLPDDKQLYHLCEKITARLDYPWSLIDAACILRVSDRTVSRRFHLSTGLSFGEWLRRKRLLHSMELLARGHNVIDAALAVGYDSPSAFSAMFKRRVGLAPCEFITQPQPMS